MTNGDGTTMTEAVPRPPRRHVRGTGSIYRRGGVWWIRYYFRGRRRRESSKSENPRDAEKLLKRRLQECGKGRMLDPAAEERVSLEDLFSALVVDYNNNARRS